jgi:hypothetical protein
MPVATEISKPDYEKIKRLKSQFPKEYKEASFIPLPKNEQTAVEYLKLNAPYYGLAYGGWLVSFIPKVGGILAMAINAIAKHYGVDTKTPFAND